MADTSTAGGTFLKAVLSVAGEYMLSLVINGQDAPQATSSLLVSNEVPQNAREHFCISMVLLFNCHAQER